MVQRGGRRRGRRCGRAADHGRHLRGRQAAADGAHPRARALHGPGAALRRERGGAAEHPLEALPAGGGAARAAPVAGGVPEPPDGRVPRRRAQRAPRRADRRVVPEDQRREQRPGEGGDGRRPRRRPLPRRHVPEGDAHGLGDGAAEAPLQALPRQLPQVQAPAAAGVRRSPGAPRERGRGRRRLRSRLGRGLRDAGALLWHARAHGPRHDARGKPRPRRRLPQHRRAPHHRPAHR
mmetsp:Transcript_16217/g.49560  ORF Transcript_16217/g.49560 Transcript_16217/m.49560 type:complete len:236 (-) Transcript_16217:705-1412(-)